MREPVRRVSAQEVVPLRHEVLRPGRPRESAILPGDELPTTSHWGAFTPERRLGAVATLMPAPEPLTGAAGWQIRGMASAPSVRGQGYAAAVVRAIAQSLPPGSLLWCNARVAALGFYRSQGFQAHGPEFEIPGAGPHFVMSRVL